MGQLWNLVFVMNWCGKECDYCDVQHKDRTDKKLILGPLELEHSYCQMDGIE